MPLYPEKPLHQHVAEMTGMAEILRPFSKSPADEGDLAVLKTREAVVDGHHVQVYYSVEDRPECRLHSVRVASRDVPYLPFWVHGQRIARAFLGDGELALSEFWVLGRKLYVWSQGRDRETGEPVPILLHPEAQPMEYDGVSYQAAPLTRIVVPGLP